MTLSRSLRRRLPQFPQDLEAFSGPSRSNFLGVGSAHPLGCGLDSHRVCWVLAAPGLLPPAQPHPTARPFPPGLAARRPGRAWRSGACLSPYRGLLAS